MKKALSYVSLALLLICAIGNFIPNLAYLESNASSLKPVKSIKKSGKPNEIIILSDSNTIEFYKWTDTSWIKLKQK